MTARAVMRPGISVGYNPDRPWYAQWHNVRQHLQTAEADSRPNAYQGLMEELITYFRITPWYKSGEVRLWTSIEASFQEDWERLLDAIHVVIQRTPTRTNRLDEILSLGGSVYTATERGIEDRVDPTANQALRKLFSRGSR
jgi:hypothetical protein